MKIQMSNSHGRMRKSWKGFFYPILKDLEHLSEFSDFEIERDPNLITPHKRCMIFQIGDKKILLDGNNTPDPSLGMLVKERADDYSLIIKMQRNKDERWDKYSIPVTEWSFSEKNYGIFRGRGEDYLASEKGFRCGFVGRSGGKYHKSRRNMVNELKTVDGVDCASWPQHQRGKHTLTSAQYIERVLKWESGYAPIGTRMGGNDGKTWREIEYAAIGMPMILQDTRNYWVPLNPHEHYIPLSDNIEEDVEKALADKELGNRLHEWYKKACSAEGMCTTFAEIITKYL